MRSHRFRKKKPARVAGLLALLGGGLIAGLAECSHGGDGVLHDACSSVVILRIPGDTPVDQLKRIRAAIRWPAGEVLERIRARGGISKERWQEVLGGGELEVLCPRGARIHPTPLGTYRLEWQLRARGVSAEFDALLEDLQGWIELQVCAACRGVFDPDLPASRGRFVTIAGERGGTLRKRVRHTLDRLRSRGYELGVMGRSVEAWLR